MKRRWFHIWYIHSSCLHWSLMWIVTQSDKTSLIARKHTHVYNGFYLLFCVCYSNSISFIALLRIFYIYGEVCAEILCSEKELLNLKDSKLTQNFYGNKTGFVRPGHNLQFKHFHFVSLLKTAQLFCAALG